MSSVEPTPGPAVASAPAPGRVASWRLLASNPLTVAAAVVLAIVVLAAVLAPWIAPYGVNQIDVANALTPPRIVANWMPAIVSTGTRAPRTMWRDTTTRRGSPFDTAVRMYPDEATSMTAARM